MAKILIIDDEQQLRGLLARIISLEGYDVTEAADCASGLKALRRCDPDVVLCDVKLPDGNGVEMVAKIKEAAPSAEVILLTAYGNIPDGVQAIKNGAFDYITKGDDNNKLLPLLSRAVEKARMQRRLARIDDSLSEQHSFDRIIGRSESLRRAVERQSAGPGGFRRGQLFGLFEGAARKRAVRPPCRQFHGSRQRQERTLRRG